MEWISPLGKQRKSKASIGDSEPEKKLEEWKFVTKMWDIQGTSRALRDRILNVVQRKSMSQIPTSLVNEE